MTENELYHHGIAGQRWGIRRYQNEDGSLTSAGKSRYSQKIVNGVRTTVTNIRNKRLSNTGSITPTKSNRLSNTVSVMPSKNASSGMVEYSKGDRDFDDSNYKEENRVSTKNNGETDFFVHVRPDGSRVLLSEDMKWEIGPGENVEEKVDTIIGEMQKKREDYWNNKSLSDYEIDSYANAVIRGDFGNGSERKEKLGAHYDEVQRRVNEKLRHCDSGYSSELYHHGILGMKWGVRRYQNKDGSYTEAGRKRKKQSIFSKANEHKRNIDKYKKDTDPKKVKRMSDEELRKRNERLAAEKRYKDLRKEQLSTGEKATIDILSQVGKTVASGILLYAGKKAVDKIFGPGAGSFIKNPNK